MNFLQLSTIGDDDQIPDYDSDGSISEEKSKITIQESVKKPVKKSKKKTSHGVNGKNDMNLGMNKEFTFEADGGDLPVSKGWDFSSVLEKFAKPGREVKSVGDRIQEVMRAHELDLGVDDEKDVVEMGQVSEEEYQDEECEQKGKDKKPSTLTKASKANKATKATKVAKETNDVGEAEDVVREKRKAAYFAPEPVTMEVKSESFLEMRLSRPILKAIAELGYTEPTLIQSRAIPLAMRGLDICGAAETGSGKTAAFIIPILERLLYRPKTVPATRVLVLVPTRELAVQCYSVSQKLSKFMDVAFSLCVGGLSTKVQEADLRKRPDVVIATPGRLIDHVKNTMNFNLDTIDILIIDEADRILQDGFAQELNEIIKSCPKSRQTMLFSATMTDNVDDLVRLSLNRPVRLFVDHNMTLTSKLTQEFIRVRNDSETFKAAMLLAICSRTYTSNAIIFFKSKAQAHFMRILFGLFKLRVAELHGNLTQLQRLQALEDFKNKNVDFLLATNLASRGLDIQGVATVINFDMPADFQQYVHRVGRTARGQQSGVSLSFVTEADRKILKLAIKNTQDQVRNRLVPIHVVQKFEAQIKLVTPSLREILAQEKQDKELAHAEMQVTKMQNMLDHHQEIKSRPKREWIAVPKSHGSAAHNALNGAPAGSSMSASSTAATALNHSRNVGSSNSMQSNKTRTLSSRKRKEPADKAMQLKQKISAKSAKRAARPTKLTRVNQRQSSTKQSTARKSNFDKEFH